MARGDLESPENVLGASEDRPTKGSPQGSIESWVIIEAAEIAEARERKRLLLPDLGLHPRAVMTCAEIRRVALFERMVTAHFKAVA